MRDCSIIPGASKKYARAEWVRSDCSHASEHRRRSPFGGFTAPGVGVTFDPRTDLASGAPRNVEAFRCEPGVTGDRGHPGRRVGSVRPGFEVDERTFDLDGTPFVLDATTFDLDEGPFEQSSRSCKETRRPFLGDGRTADRDERCSRRTRRTSRRPGRPPRVPRRAALRPPTPAQPSTPGTSDRPIPAMPSRWAICSRMRR
jgi:hypothetical protein